MNATKIIKLALMLRCNINNCETQSQPLKQPKRCTMLIAIKSFFKNLLEAMIESRRLAAEARIKSNFRYWE